MTYEDLDLGQRAQLDAFMVTFRPLMGETARLFTKLSALQDAWNGGVSAIVDGLDVGAVIASPTGLAGAGTLARENVAGTMTDFTQAIGAFNAEPNRQAYIRAAGLANVL